MAYLLKTTCRRLLTKFQVYRNIQICQRYFSTTCVLNKEMEYKRQIFSGIQPTGIPHIGNYLGAIKHWVDLQQRESNVIFSIVDLHSITLPQDPEDLRCKILDMVACLLACGLDPDKCILFLQSAVPQHTELCWILSCLCTIPRLQRLPQWREKKKLHDDPGVGLLTYPVLQAADILLYKATDIPVGEDQVHHIELARHLAKLFNNKYREFFPLPNTLPAPVTKIRSLRNPSVKMSKSDRYAKSQITLTDSPDDIRETVKKAVTDFTSTISYDPEERPGISNLIEIYQGFTELTPEVICEQSQDLDTVGFKSKLAEVLIEKLTPIRTEIERLQQNKDFLWTVLEKGRVKAEDISVQNISEVHKLIGFR